MTTANLQPESHWGRRLEITVPRAQPGITEQIIDDEAVLYDCQTGRIHRLNETALSVWKACDGKATNLQLAERITREYSVPFERAVEDVEQTIAAFARTGLVTEAVPA
ncbi:MAG: HPr-rel-A system PqqD family peptide chaperone [bacterium]|nr:HPr-rel-A system PqqD family peptide chaperone [bacterium]